MNLMPAKLTPGRRAFYLLLGTAACFFTPFAATLVKYCWKVPEGMIRFPATEPNTKAGFNLIVAVAISLSFVAVSFLFLLPSLFGFKPPLVPDPQTKPTRKGLPVWFWLGLLLWAGALALLGLKAREPAWLVNWALLPLFWGFTLVLDGWVYVRKGGRSMVSRSFRELIAIGMVSISGWLVFEWLNFFVHINWYYPKASILPHDEFLLYAVTGSSGLMPMAFEWYELLSSFHGLRERYRRGPTVRVTKTLQMILLLGCFTGLFATVFRPDLFFFVLWVAPLIILSILLEWMGIWTPFTPLGQGDWAPLLLFSLTYLVQGFLLESWNYASGFHQSGGELLTHNPAYWAYTVPYVDFFHVFEMPILGYLGYLPFGAYCWVWWITTSYILDIRSGYTYDPEFRHKKFQE